ncbi:MAG: hypothetical protein EZS28_010156 [Streblomastix strix]|uniref:Uncharacterized protein n=1 Tax=Streblomastix strix TaxID=222440 RepID=A0A5J4WH16_9EUKA|nr:MAG: hypothetical protein EZS28_010156 [Streblomastix strix]
MCIEGTQVHSFGSSAATQLVVMGLVEALLNTFIGHVRIQTLRNDYYVFAERLMYNEISTKLSETHGLIEGNSISSPQQR